MSKISSSAIFKSAELSECGRYRYRLYRSWGDGPFVVFLMFNPSTADAETDDPTIRKCVGFAQRWKYGGVAVVNLFAFRSSDPTAIGKHLYADAVGPKNDEAILTACATAAEVVLAWGCSQHFKSHRDRPAKILQLIRKHYPALKISCLGKSKDGHPYHPLMLGYLSERRPYNSKLQVSAPAEEGSDAE
jgi:hypothetical protein